MIPIVQMKNEIIFHSVKFWLDQNIVHCSFNDKVDNRFLDFEIENIFVEAISAFTIGNCKPILIDLTKVSDLKAYNIYKYISNNTKLKSFVLSKSFLVKSFNMKLLFKLYSFIDDGIIPIQISTDLQTAVQYSNEKYIEFNAY